MKRLLLVTISLILVSAGWFAYKYKTDRFFYRTMRFEHGIGHSMEPTLPYDSVVKSYKVAPKVGDIISFHCSKSECLKWGENFKTDGNFAKRLTKIREDGAIWVDGDNKDNSFDSDYFGWILPNEFSDVWVVKVPNS